MVYLTAIRWGIVMSVAAGLGAGVAYAQNIQKMNPDNVAPPIVPEYSHLAVVPSGMKLLYLAGQLGIRPDGSIPESFDDQLIQAYENVRHILASQGASPQDIVKVSVYAVGEPVDRKRLSEYRHRFFAGAPHPASTFIFVSKLARPDFLVEVEAIAAVPVSHQ
ncbi:Rid family hydrolase [Paraburkholderia phymatum]|nr:Rid family hydrolase [Paraburkholderia phymatum]